MSEGRSEGPVINQLDSDEDLPSPPSLIHIRVGLHTQQYTSSPHLKTHTEQADVSY